MFIFTIFFIKIFILLKLNSIQKIIPEVMIVKQILMLLDKDIGTIEYKFLFFGQIRIWILGLSTHFSLCSLLHQIIQKARKKCKITWSAITFVNMWRHKFLAIQPRGPNKLKLLRISDEFYARIFKYHKKCLSEHSSFKFTQPFLSFSDCGRLKCFYFPTGKYRGPIPRSWTQNSR